MQQPPEQLKLIKPHNLSISVTKQALSPTVSKQMLSPTDLDSPTRRKKLQSLKKASDIEYAKNQLNSYLDVLDKKVNKLVQKHQAQFLVAYRNHVKKVREEMDQISKKALSNANSTVSQTQKIEALEKQLTIFREESLKLFQKVNEKQGTIYNLKTKIDQLKTEKHLLQRSLRQLTLRNKKLEGLNYQFQSKKSAMQSNSNINQKQFFISRPQNQDIVDFKNMYKLDISKPGSSAFARSRPYTTAINSKGSSIRPRNHSIQIHQPFKNIGPSVQQDLIEQKIDEILKGQVNQNMIRKLKQQISQILQNQENSRQKSKVGDLGLTTAIARQNSVQKDAMKKTKSLFQSKTHYKKSELEEYFYKSIEAVRKEIVRRRGLKSMNFYSEYANLSIAEFKKVDFFRLLQLLFSNDKIISTLHRAVFQQSKAYN